MLPCASKSPTYLYAPLFNLLFNVDVINFRRSGCSCRVQRTYAGWIFMLLIQFYWGILCQGLMKWSLYVTYPVVSCDGSLIELSLSVLYLKQPVRSGPDVLKWSQSSSCLVKTIMFDVNPTKRSFCMARNSTMAHSILMNLCSIVAGIVFAAYHAVLRVELRAKMLWVLISHTSRKGFY